MKDIAKLIVAILVIVVAWKIIKGLIGLLIGVAIAAVVVFVGMKLLDDRSR